jgi:dihydrofolate reductase
LPSMNLNKVGKKIAILGGAQTYAWCLEQGIFDELYLTVEPIVFGRGINLFGDKTPLDKKFRLKKIQTFNKQGTILFHYKTQKS